MRQSHETRDTGSDDGAKAVDRVEARHLPSRVLNAVDEMPRQDGQRPAHENGGKEDQRDDQSESEPSRDSGGFEKMRGEARITQPRQIQKQRKQEAVSADRQLEHGIGP